jgi:hypothetical protein
LCLDELISDLFLVRTSPTSSQGSTRHNESSPLKPKPITPESSPLNNDTVLYLEDISDKENTPAPTRASKTISRGKRTAAAAGITDGDNIDNEAETTDQPIAVKSKTPRLKLILKPQDKSNDEPKPTVRHSRKTATAKKQKLVHQTLAEFPADRPHIIENINHNYVSDDDLMTDHETSVAPEENKTENTNVNDDKGPGDEHEGSSDIILVEAWTSRYKRIVKEDDPKNAELIAKAIADGKMAGDEVYDTDGEDDPNTINKNVKNPEWYQPVRWGEKTFDTEDATWNPTVLEEFTNFVPGRWEHMPNGEVRDQKHKCIIKLVDLNGKKVTFHNNPPKDWSDQKAISALSKRVVQQIRRNTNYRFRDVVTPYLPEERKWILTQLNVGKPKKGFRAFRADFNKQFAGKKLAGDDSVRPYRSESSLQKELDGRKEDYKNGHIPVLCPVNEKRKGGVSKRVGRVGSKANSKKTT